MSQYSHTLFENSLCPFREIVNYFRLHTTGFVTREDGGGDVFVHQSDIHSEGFRSLRELEPVEFELEEIGDGRYKAVKVGDNAEPVFPPFFPEEPVFPLFFPDCSRCRHFYICSHYYKVLQKKRPVLFFRTRSTGKNVFPVHQYDTFEGTVDYRLLVCATKAHILSFFLLLLCQGPKILHTCFVTSKITTTRAHTD